ncbi:cytochrome c oxidase subunit 4 [Propionibacteriaceae bacterium Y1923]
MKASAKIFLFLLIYFIGVTALYYFMTGELVGTVALALSAVMCAIVFTYISIAAKGAGQIVSDDLDGEVYQGAGEMGFFPPKSIWPLWVALTIAVILLGPPLGWWLTLAGVGMGLWSLSGWVFEFYRGDYAH